MNKAVLIKPILGKKIPVPEMGYVELPDNGMELQLTNYWKKRIAEGGVEIVEAPKQDDKKKTSIKEVE